MMDKSKQQSDEGGMPRANPELSAELKRLYQAPGSVPAEVDRAILERARTHFADQSGQAMPAVRRTRLVWRRVGRVAAIAAAVAIVFIVWPSRVSERPAEEPLRTARQDQPAIREDIDRNGRVDILDAFAMARRLEARGAVEAGWDFNGDKVVNRADVNLVACAAVRIPEGG